MNIDAPTVRLTPLVQALIECLPGLVVIDWFESFGAVNELAECATCD